MFKFGAKSLEILNGLHPLLKMVLEEAIETAPFDFGLHEGQRSIERQKELFDKGKSLIDGINSRGYHNYKPALAVDFHCSIKGNTWDNEREEVDGDPAYLEEIARHIQAIAKRRFNIKLVWGGDWKKFKDAPHIQLPKPFKDKAEELKLY